MRFADAFRCPFDSPRWAFNLLVTAVANIVPLIGPIFVIGYVAHVMESLRGGAGRDGYHDVDFDRIGDYLLRGAKVFVVSFLLGLLVLPFYLVFMLGSFLLVPLFAGGGGASDGASGAAAVVLGCLGAGVFFSFLLVFVLGMMLVSVPLVLRASLHPEFGAAFSPSFVLDFVRRCWKQIVLSYLVFFVASIPLSILGLIAFVVGVFVVSAYLQLVHGHLLAQLADFYEAEGGEPVAGTSVVQPGPTGPPALPG